MVRFVEVETQDIECPLFCGVSGSGLVCNLGGLAGAAVAVQADNTLELREFMEFHCYSRYTACPAYRKAASLVLMLANNAKEEGGVL